MPRSAAHFASHVWVRRLDNGPTHLRRLRAFLRNRVAVRTSRRTVICDTYWETLAKASDVPELLARAASSSRP